MANQVLPGVEQHRGLMLEPEQVDIRYSPTRSFALRYGFLDRPYCIRFRILDGTLSSLSGLTTPDVALDAVSFASLQLRSRFPHTQSMLMDEATLRVHEPLWGEEGTPVLHHLPRLTLAEQSVYDVLRQNRFAQALRLEQERIGFQCVEAALRKFDVR